MCSTLSCMHLQRKLVSAQVFGYEKEIVGGRTWRAEDIVVLSSISHCIPQKSLLPCGSDCAVRACCETVWHSLYWDVQKAPYWFSQVKQECTKPSLVRYCSKSQIPTCNPAKFRSSLQVALDSSSMSHVIGYLYKAWLTSQEFQILTDIKLGCIMEWWGNITDFHHRGWDRSF